MTKNTIEHHDKLGRPLTEGACVAFSVHNTLVIGTVKKLHFKQLTVMPFGKNKRGHYKYPSDTVVVDGPDISIFLLKNSG